MCVLCVCVCVRVCVCVCGYENIIDNLGMRTIGLNQPGYGDNHPG